MADGNDIMTELRALHGRVMTKRIGRHPETGAPAVTSSYDQSKWYAVAEHTVGSLLDAAAVTERTSLSSASCFVMDSLRESWTSERTKRNGQTFVSVPHRYVFLDIDGLACPPGLDWRADPEAAVRHAIGTLPAEFHDVSCWWQFTSSQGIKDGLRLRLLFWLDRPTTCAEFKIWLCETVPDPALPEKRWPQIAPAVDSKLYDRVHVIYVARPIFEDGVTDPVPRRSGLLSGSTDAVAVPTPIVPRFTRDVAARARTARQPRGERSDVSVTQPYRADGAGFAHHLTKIGDGPGLGRFYGPMVAAVAAWVGAHGPDADATDMQVELAAAMRGAPRDPREQTVEDVERHIANMASLLEWVRQEERRKKAARTAVGTECDPPCALATLGLAEAQAYLRKGANAVFDE